MESSEEEAHRGEDAASQQCHRSLAQREGCRGAAEPKQQKSWCSACTPKPSISSGTGSSALREVPVAPLLSESLHRQRLLTCILLSVLYLPCVPKRSTHKSHGSSTNSFNPRENRNYKDQGTSCLCHTQHVRDKLFVTHTTHCAAPALGTLGIEPHWERTGTEMEIHPVFSACRKARKPSFPL